MKLTLRRNMDWEWSSALVTNHLEKNKELVNLYWITLPIHTNNPLLFFPHITLRESHHYEHSVVNVCTLRHTHKH